MALPNTLRVFRGFPNPARSSTPGTMSEMFPSYKSKFPYNNLKATDGGHLFEMDDTPGAERVHIFHRSGSHVEMRPDGAVKYKSVKNRQDVTIGDHEIIIQGDFNITVDGGSKILVRNGSLEIQSDYGAAINVKGELKLSADNIRMQAKQKIALVAPFVDVGGTSVSPYMSLPIGVVPVFGVPVPIMTGLAVPKIANFVTPSAGANPAAGVASLVSSVTTIVSQLNTVASYARNIAKSKALFSAMKDTLGDPLVPEVDQPDEIPLLNPRLYNGIGGDNILLRDRQFDSPDDVDDTEVYTAHLNLSEELKDFTSATKSLPGQKIESDESTPTEEPIPVQAFELRNGTVSCSNGSNLVVGTDTKFTEELEIGQVLKIQGNDVTIAAVENNTSLVLSTEWNYPSTNNSLAFVHILRPFSEFMDKYTYPRTTRLGASTLTLADMMRNYIPPTIEKENFAVPVPIGAATPPASANTAVGTDEVREVFTENKEQNYI